MNYLEQKRYADSQSLEWLINASQGQEEHPYVDRFVLHSAVGDKLAQQASFDALQAKAEGKADPQTTAVDRQIEEAQRMLAERGGIAGVDPGMGQELLPEEMAALQSGIAGGPPMNMEPEPQQMPQDLMQAPPGTPNMMAAGGGLIPGYQRGRLVGGPDPDIVGYMGSDISDEESLSRGFEDLPGMARDYWDYLRRSNEEFKRLQEAGEIPEVIGGPGMLEALGPGLATRGLGLGKGLWALRNKAGRQAAVTAMDKLLLRTSGKMKKPPTPPPTTPMSTALTTRRAVGPVRGPIRRGLDWWGGLPHRKKTLAGLAGANIVTSAQEKPLLDEHGEIVPTELRWDPESWLGGLGGRGGFGEESPSFLESVARVGSKGLLGLAGLGPRTAAGVIGGVDAIFPGNIPWDDWLREKGQTGGYHTAWGLPWAKERVPIEGAVDDDIVNQLADAIRAGMLSLGEDDAAGSAASSTRSRLNALINEYEDDLRSISPETQEYHDKLTELAALKLAREKELKTKREGYMADLTGRIRSPERREQERLGQVMLGLGTTWMGSPRGYAEGIKETSQGLRSLDTLREQQQFDLEDRIQNMDLATLRDWMDAQDVSENVQAEIMREAAERSELSADDIRISLGMQELAHERGLETLEIEQAGLTERAALALQGQVPQLFEAYSQAIHTVRNQLGDSELADDMFRRLARMLEASLPRGNDPNYDLKIQRLNSITLEGLVDMIAPELESLGINLEDITDAQVSEAAELVLGS